MTIKMNNHQITQIKTASPSQKDYLANVQYVNDQSEIHGENALKGYPESIQNLQNEISHIQTQLVNLVKLDGSSVLSGNVQCPTISGLETPQSTQTTNIANVNYIQETTGKITTQISNNTNEIQNIKNEITKIENHPPFVKTDGSSVLSGNVQCSTISGLEIPNSTEPNNAVNVDYVHQAIQPIINYNLPYIFYGEGTMKQSCQLPDIMEFDQTNLISKSSTINSFIEIQNNNSILFLKPGLFYINVNLGDVTGTPSDSVIFLGTSSGQDYIIIKNLISSTLIKNTSIQYNLFSYITIRNENTKYGQSPTIINIIPFGQFRGGFPYVTTFHVAKMSWFLFGLNPISKK